ncbi:hypothetical protein ASD89_01080 [Caulobacter sp. Root656]|nr:hypothetical protein ASD89_01080 [Caulobacter sp. Root656]
MSIYIDPAAMKAFLIEAGVEFPVTAARRDEVIAAIEQALDVLIAKHEQQPVENRIELVINAMNANLKQQLGAQTWKVIGSMFVMLSLALIVAKLF